MPKFDPAAYAANFDPNAAPAAPTPAGDAAATSAPGAPATLSAGTPWDADPVANPLDVALAAENASPQVAAVAKSIYQQESGSGKNTETSNAGAQGGMQLIPSTFNSVADPGWDIKDPVQNARAGVRYVAQMAQLAGGNPALTAAGYYGGPNAIAKAQQGIAVSDPRNPNAPNTLQYGQQVAARIPQAAPQGSQGNPWDNDPIVSSPPGGVVGGAASAPGVGNPWDNDPIVGSPQSPGAALGAAGNTRAPGQTQQPVQGTPGTVTGPAVHPGGLTPSIVQSVPGTADNVGPPVSAKNPTLAQSLGNFASQVVNHPLDTASNIGNAITTGAANLGKQYMADPLGTINGAIRGLADGATFGTADKLAALANSQLNGTSYQDELLKQRQADQDSGPAFTAGQLGSGLLTDGAGAVGLARMVPTTSKVARVAAGSFGERLTVQPTTWGTTMDRRTMAT